MKILLKTDVMDLLKISEGTLYRWVSESRSGKGTFTLPISQPGKTLRWNADDLEHWCQPKVAITKQSTKRPKTTSPSQKQASLQSTLKKHGL